MSDFWSEPLSTSLLHVCEQRRLWQTCTGSPESSLVASVVSTLISWAGSFRWMGSFMSVFIWATSWENVFMPYANDKGTDQLKHLRNLISTFFVRCRDGIIPPVMQNFKPLASFWSWAGRFKSYLIANPEDRFSCDVIHIILGWWHVDHAL